ncbi:MAG: hypothetical protein ACL9RN_05975 [Cylindrospermopsis raciborskii]|uniref:hypothetical protein n=1 Tax=Cylindrospermopsis raciborskii TaxID=77022 RepID=UPI003D104362
MAQIKVQNFGPIKSGLTENEGLVNIRKITLAIKAQQILQTFDNFPKGEFLKTKLKNIVPLNSSIFPEDSIVYELTDSGEIRKLSTYEGLPSDENYLNSCLAETNRFFSDLLEIEEEILFFHPLIRQSIK